VIDRVEAAVARLTARHRGRDIVAVGHGGSIRAALALALGLEPERALAFVIDNCSLTRLDHIHDDSDAATAGGVWRVAAVNLKPQVRPWP
jgi:broad specificity phosphatase PhoE